MKASTAQNLGIAEAVAEPGHAALGAVGATAPLCDVEQQPIGMMPGMPGLVVRRRRQRAVGAGRSPVGFALQRAAVTDRAVLLVDDIAQRDLLCVARIGETDLVLTRQDGAGNGDDRGHRDSAADDERDLAVTGGSCSVFLGAVVVAAALLPVGHLRSSSG